ncbi:MAG TPA: tetratricopeptide repeat protein [Kofleriaceae bacterium]|nr:tetratricopeptide repeat protein [Kofleriaceae bacterium]
MSRSAMLSLVALIALAVIAPAPARADETAAGPVPDVAASAVGPSADAWLRIGLERYERGNLVGAIEAFEKGYQREARPMFLFALGQAHRKRGDCDRARGMYDAFLATHPTQTQADAAVEQREACEPPPPEPEAAPAAPAPPPEREVVIIDNTTRTSAWYRDPIAVGSGGATVALLGTGVLLWLSAEKSADGAATADTYARHAQLRERAESRQLQAGLALGAAAVTAGVTVWRIARDRTERAPARGATLQPVVGAQGVGVVLGGRF